jgi:hypothetical protein
VADDILPRSLLLDHVRRQTDLTLQLGSQLQTRAEIITGTISILLTIAGVLIAAESPIFERLDDHGYEGHASATFILLLVSLAFAIVAAVPRKMVLTKASWLRAVALDDEVLVPMTPEEVIDLMAPVIHRLDGAEIDAFDKLRSSTSLRGYLLYASLVSLGIATALVAWIAYHIRP